MTIPPHDRMTKCCFRHTCACLHALTIKLRSGVEIDHTHATALAGSWSAPSHLTNAVGKAIQSRTLYTCGHEDIPTQLMTAWIPIRFTLEALGCNVGTLFVPTPSGFQGGKSAAFFTRRHRKIFALAKNTGAALYHPVSAFGTGGEDGWSVRPRLSSI